MPAIFISHSSLDPQIADDIKTALDRLGFEQVFLDFDKETGIPVGEDWERRLYGELSRCHAVILMLTPNWLASKWCFAELTQARALGKVILPIVCKPLGERFVLPEIQSVDLLDWNAGGLDKLEQRLRAITNELARGFKLDPNRPPYPGIHAFEAEDAAIYFGRDDEARAVIERLDARRIQGGARCLVVIGASGSGKSSLLKAGVLPQLSRRRSEWVLLPCIRPEKAPVETLAKSIAQQIGKPDDWRIWQATLGSPVAVDHIEELLKDLRVGDARAATVLLPIDQFEEAFAVATTAERAIFLHLLASALDPARDLPLMVIATGRSDVLEGLLEAGELAPLTETYPLIPMPLDRVPRLVEGPAQVAGLNVEEGLSEAIARDVESPEALPLLAHTLWLLYRRGSGDKKLSLAEYHSLGDPERGLNPVQNSVRLVADQAIGGLKPADAELAALRDAFVPHLVRVRLDDGKRVRQPARLSDLPSESLRLIRALVEARLLSTRAAGESDGTANDAGEAVVEVTHEALFKAWPTLDQWLTQEHAFLSDIERIKSAHDIWTQAPDAQKARALLGGLLLSRARDWLVKYPQRFLSRDMAALCAFIADSAEAEDAERARVRRVQCVLFRGAIAAAIVFAAAAAFSGWQYFAADRAKQVAEERRNQAEIAESHFLADRAIQDADSGDTVTAALLALAALPDDKAGVERPYVPAAELALFGSSQQRGDIAVLKSHDEWTVSAVFSPDGGRVVTASLDGTARIWDVATRVQIAVLEGHEAGVNGVAFSPDGRRVVTASADGSARIWDAATQAQIAVFKEHRDQVMSAAFSPDGRRVVTASSDKTARIWDAATGIQIVVFEGHDDAVNDAAFSPDGKRVVTASSDKTARIWDAATGAQIAVLAGHEGPVNSAAFSPDGKRVLTASSDHTARMWDAATALQIAVFEGHDTRVNSAAFSPDGDRIVTASGKFGGPDPTARIWDAATQTKIAVLRGHDNAVLTAVFSADGGRVLTASFDKTARIWVAATGSQIAVFKGYDDAVRSAVFSPDGRRLVTASLDNTARIWDAATQALIAVFEGHDDVVKSAAFSPDGQRVVTASSDKTARIWDAATPAQIAVFEGHDDAVNSAAFSPDGRRVVTGSSDKTARIWDAATRAQIAVFEGHDDAVNSAAFSPDGRRVVTGSSDKTARIWDAATGAQIAVLVGHEGSVNSAAFSPDGRRVVTASSDKTARIWDAVTGAQIAVLVGHEGPVNSAGFSPDGKRVLTASDDNTGRIWDAATQAQIAVLKGDEDHVLSAAFSPDGRRVVTSSDDKTVRIWKVFPTTQDLVDYAKEIVPRCLTPQERAVAFLDSTPPVWCMEVARKAALPQRAESQPAAYPPGEGSINQPLTATAKQHDDIVIALSFSGGGLRAAAFSLGVLRGFDETQVKNATSTTSLLDRIDFVSGVSGGSVLAAYYGLKKRLALADFKERFLLQNVEQGRQTNLSPGNTAPGSQSAVNDMTGFPTWLDAHLFNNATLKDLLFQQRPRIWINAADIYNRTPFEFDRTTFAALCNDIASYPVSYAVAASVPAGFAPFVIESHPGNCPAPLPEWIVRVRDDDNASPLIRTFADALERYHTGEIRYAKLLDGGLIDKYGLAGFTFARLSSTTPFDPLEPEEAIKLGRLLYFVVDPGREPSGAWAQTAGGPYGADLLTAITDTASAFGGVGIYSTFGDTMGNWRNALIKWRCGFSEAESRRLGASPGWNCRDLKFFVGRIAFDQLGSERAAALNAIETGFALPPAQVEMLIAAGRDALKTDTIFHSFLDSLSTAPPQNDDSTDP